MKELIQDIKRILKSSIDEGLLDIDDVYLDEEGNIIIVFQDEEFLVVINKVS